MTAPSLQFSPTPRITWPYFLFQGTTGATLGFYVFTMGPLIFTKLASEPLGSPGAGSPFLGLMPIQWAAVIFSFGIFAEVILEVPTGLVADALGRKTNTVASLIFRAVFFGFLTLLCVVETLVPWAYQQAAIILCGLAAVLTFSLSYTLQSGAVEAWVTDSLYELAKVRFAASGTGERRPVGEGDPGEDYLKLGNGVTLTAEQKQTVDATLAAVFTRGETCYWLTFLAGTMVGIFLYQNKLPEIAFLWGMGACIFCAGACGMYMLENRTFTFIRLRALWRGEGRTVLRRMWRSWRRGFGAFKSDPRLWAVFGTAAAFSSLVYLVDYVWLLFTDRKFPQFYATYWVAFVAVMTLTALAGNLALERWLDARKRAGRPVRFAGLVWMNTALNFFFAIPIFAVAIAVSGNGAESMAVTFLALLAAHKFFEAPARSTSKTLQNLLIPPTSEDRATILSWGGLFGNVVIAVLMIVGVGKNPDTIATWQWPAGVLVIASIVMLATLLRSSGRAKSIPETQKP
jgi:hypothetical protein